MSRLALALLGPFQALYDSHPVRFRSWKERALLAYLAAEADRFHSRLELVALLWSNMSEREGLANLRLTLSRLRRAIQDNDENTYLLVTRQGVRWNPAADAEVDIQTFRRGVEAGSGDAESAALLKAAVAVYQGDFLGGFTAEEEEPFAEWSRVWRERLHQQMLSALFSLGEAALQAAAYSEVEPYAYRQLEMEAWREEAHRQLMQALAGQGQRSAALRQYDTAARVLEEELGLEPEPATIALYEQIRDMPPPGDPQPPPTPPTNLPTRLTPFIGRDDEVTFILNRVLARDERWLSLVGEGGIGKSRLAVAAGQRLLNDFAGGVWWVALSEIDPTTPDPTQSLVECIRRVFALPMSDQNPALEVLTAFLRHKRLLLILDNFETVLDAAPVVLHLLEACPQLYVLVTSREALHYQAEVVLPIQGLPLPPSTAPNPLVYSSVRLLTERAERTGWRMEMRYTNDIVHLCRFLRGVPLALELAATALGKVALTTLLTELQHSYDLLATSMRDVPPRHRSLQAVFETSWRLLSPREQTVLSQCVIFRGRFDAAAAAAVVRATPTILQRLVSASLLRQESDGWYSLHDHLRTFAHRQLPLTPATMEGYSSHYLGMVADSLPRMYSPDLPDTLTEVQTHRSNIYQAWAWAIEQGAWEAITDAVAPLRRALHILGDIRDGQTLFQQLTAALAPDAPTTRELYLEATVAYISFLARSEQITTALQLAERVLTWADLPPALHADVLTRYASLLQTGERAHETDHFYREAWTLAQQAGDVRLEATIALAASDGAWFRSDYKQAQTYADTALPLLKQSGDLWTEMKLLNRLGILAINDDVALDRAEPYFQQSLALSRRLYDRVTEGVVLGNLGIVAAYKQMYEGAFQVYQEALALHQERGNLHTEAMTNMNIGRLSYLVGLYQEAQPYLEAALRQFGEVENPRGRGIALTYLGAVQTARGNPKDAIPLLEEAAHLFRTLNLTMFLSFPIGYLGEAYLESGDYAKAEVWLKEGVALRQKLEDIVLLKDVLALLVRLYMVWGKREALTETMAALVVNLESTGVGADHLVADYGILYEAQLLVGDPAAPATLRRARALMNDIVAAMQDVRLQQAFLGIAAHRALRR